VGAAPRGGAAVLEVAGAAEGLGGRGMALPGTRCCSSGSGCGQESGPDTTLGDEGSGGTLHSLRREWGEAFPADSRETLDEVVRKQRDQLTPTVLPSFETQNGKC
jgi:hypothetical protein